MGDRRARRAPGPRDPRVSWGPARESLRDLDRDVGSFCIGRGAGCRVLQVVHEPSFDPGFSWEVRKSDDQFAVYRSSVEHLWHLRTLLRGYSQLEVSSETLESYWEDVREVTVHLSALDAPTAGFDGEMFQLALFAGFTTVRFTWWCDPPREWVPLHAITLDMMDTFREAAEIEA
jgi:hypothetical protein